MQQRKLLIAAMAALAVAPAHATTFTTTQAVSGGATLTLGSGDAVTISNGNVGVNFTGAGTLSNAGSVSTQGGRAVDHNSAAAAIIDNTGTITSAGNNAVAGRNTTAGASIAVTNSGTMSSGTLPSTVGSEGVTFNNMIGSNNLVNEATGVITAVGADAMRPGQNGTVTNHGRIEAHPVVTSGAASGSDAIDLRTQKFVTVTNDGILRGRAGIATDGANVGPSKLTLINNNGGSIEAVNGSGLNLDGVNTTVQGEVTNNLGATIKGGCLSTTTDCDGDGIDVDGVLTLNNYGDVLGYGAKGPNNPEGIAAGGGTINNYSTGRIIGSSLSVDAPNGDNTKSGNGILIDDSNGAGAPAALTVVNYGLIWGKSGFAIRTLGTQADSITNEADGIIQGAPASGAALETGGGADMVSNAGSIIGDNGTAIDLGDGDDTLTINGGDATVDGDILGGNGSDTVSFDLGGSNSFILGYDLSGVETISVNSGTLELNAGGNIAGGSVVVASGGTLAGRGGSAPVTLAGTLAPDTANGMTLNSLTLEDGSTLWFAMGATVSPVSMGGAFTYSGAGTTTVNLADGGGFAAGDYTLIGFNNHSGLSAGNLVLGSLPAGFVGGLELTGSALIAHVAAADAVPDALNFPNAADASLNTVTASKVLTPVGYNTAATVTVRNGEYRINGGGWTGAAGTINPGQTLQLRTTSASTASTGKSMAVVVGGVTSGFIVRTGAAAAPSDTSPDVFSIANQANANLNVLASSRPVTPVGYDAPAVVSVAPAGCFYRVNGGGPVTSGTMLTPGDSLQLATTTPNTNATKFFCDVTVGTTKVRWIGKTQ